MNALPAHPYGPRLRTLGWLALALIVLVLVWPLANTALQAGNGWDEVLLDGWYAQRVVVTGLLGLMGAGLCVALGVPLAWAMWRWPVPGQALWLRLLLLPFLVPAVVGAMAIQSLIPDGLVSDAGSLPLLLWGFVFYNLGLVLWLTLQALERIPVASLMAARQLGAGPLRLVWRVIVPAIAPAVGSAALLVFFLCATSFALPLLLGGPRWTTLEVDIYTLTAFELNLGAASLLGAAQWLLGALALLAYQRLSQRLTPGSAPAAATGFAGQTRAWAGPQPRLARVLTALALLAASGLTLGPLLALLRQSLTLDHIPGVAWTVLLSDITTWQALGHSLTYTALCLPVALLLGVLLGPPARTPRRGEPGRWLALAQNQMAALPWLVSASLLSLALLITWPQWADQLALLLLGYVLLAYPLVVRALAQTRVPPQLWQAARSLGAAPRRAWWRVIWPQQRPGVQLGLALAAASSLGEFTVTLFLSRPEWQTLTTLIYDHLGRPGRINLALAQAGSVLLLIVCASVFAVLTWGAGTHRSLAGPQPATR
ncbi:ABC transporter permease [Amphibiibacter pelophylacis]|uniref:ABC transporter permease subunit n=1 Tax=Amphibiibacter pelophylacis TaxID=1799477 RepID=A0ACC6P2V8_9BURK